MYTRSAHINVPSIAGLSLMLGGGFSNLYDRIFNNGAVVDFLNVGIVGLRTGIFNVADMALMLGAALLIYFQYIASEEK